MPRTKDTSCLCRGHAHHNHGAHTGIYASTAVRALTAAMSWRTQGGITVCVTVGMVLYFVVEPQRARVLSLLLLTRALPDVKFTVSPCLQPVLQSNSWCFPRLLTQQSLQQYSNLNSLRSSQIGFQFPLFGIIRVQIRMGEGGTRSGGGNCMVFWSTARLAIQGQHQHVVSCMDGGQYRSTPGSARGRLHRWIVVVDGDGRRWSFSPTWRRTRQDKEIGER